MSKMIVDGLTAKELEAAREALITLYELKDEYAKAQRNLQNVEMRMAQMYDTVNYFFRHVKNVEGESK